MSGRVTIHDELVPIPGAKVHADVKGIQINDEEFEEAGPGIRVGLSLKGVTAAELEKSPWLADPSISVSARLTVSFQKSSFYRGEISGRDLHLQLPGALVPAKFSETAPGKVQAELPSEVPVWNGMRVAVVDLNGRPLRVAGGGTCIL